MAEKKKKLTEKEELFCYYYSRCLNSAKAARLAGYSPNSAFEIGSQNYRKLHIKARIKELLKENINRDNLKDELTSFLRNISTANIGDFLDEQGNVDPIKVRECSLPGLITGYNTKYRKDPETKQIIEASTTIKMADALKASDLLSKLEKFLDETPRIELPDKVIFEVVNARKE